MRRTNRSGIHEKSEEDQTENIQQAVSESCSRSTATLELQAKGFLSGDWPLLTQAALATNC